MADSSEQIKYKWRPIEPLADSDEKIDIGSVKPLYLSWHESRERLRTSSAKGLDLFNAQLVRRLSIETGILERLYDLDRGTTEALVAHGFAEDLIARSSTDIEPARLVDILRDQEAAIKVVMDCVSNRRPLTKGILHELQATLTRHQTSTSAIDTLGNRFEIPLEKGRFKAQPNNPRRPDGSIHEYCPPIHIDSEVDNLISWLETYSDKDPILVAAWLHHRFTQIHPYQDGNGRVSRALTTLVLMRANLLPLVIDRDLRTEYIESLEQADAGDLSKLALLFSRLEKNAILQALSVDADREIVQHNNLSQAVILNLSEKFNKRKQDRSTSLRKVNAVAIGLRHNATLLLEENVEQLKNSLALIDTPQIRVEEGGADKGNGHWYRFEVSRSAKDAGKYANLTEDHYFLKTTVRLNDERLVFIVSFHHAGRELSGIMEATSFARLESFDDSEEKDKASEEFVICSVDPFVFTNLSKGFDLKDSFARWLDAAFAVAVSAYGEKL